MSIDKRKFILLTLAIIGIGIFGCRKGSVYPALIISASPTNVNVGDIVTVDVEVQKVTNAFGVAFDIAYDPKILQFQMAEGGGFLKTNGVNTKFDAALENKEDGRLIVGNSQVAGAEGITGSGYLVKAYFKVIGAGASTDILLENTGLKDPNGGVILTKNDSKATIYIK